MTRSSHHLKISLLLLLNSAWLVSHAQHLEEWEKTYPDAAAVYANMSNYVKINFENKKPGKFI